MKETSFSTEGIIEIELTCGSDYSGDTVTRSNYEYCIKHFSNFPGFYDLYGGFSGYGIGYIESELTEEGRAALKAILDYLTDYPLLDEEGHSELEMKLKDEYWESEAKDLLAPYLADDEEVSNLPERFLMKAREVFDQWAIIETGQLVYCDAKRFRTELSETYDVEEVYFDGRYRITRADRGLTAMYHVNECNYIEANDEYLTPRMMPAEDIAEYVAAGLFDFIATDNVARKVSK